MTLDEEDIEAIAVRVADRLRDRPGGAEWMTVAEVAELLGVSATFVYDHQQQLGARKLGTSSRSPLRFPRERVVSWVDSPAAPRSRPRGRPRKTAGVKPLGGLKARTI